MLNFGAVKAIDFLPDEDSRAWLAEALTKLQDHLGAASQTSPLLSAPPSPLPRDLDGLFDVMCAVQSGIGQGDVEFTLVEFEGRPMPPPYRPLGDPQGQLMHTFVGPSDIVVVALPEVFRVSELLLACVARELGRIELHRRGGSVLREHEREAEAELAATLLGLGVWVANGAYRFENKCCGGGCGINLSQVRAGLSLPEICFALALEGQRRGWPRRTVLRHLAATQKAAAKRSWSVAGQSSRPALTSGGSPALAKGTRIST